MSSPRRRGVAEGRCRAGLQVKWLTEVQLAEEDAPGMWNRGLAYKVFGPSVTSVTEEEIAATPTMQEAAPASRPPRPAARARHDRNLRTTLTARRGDAAVAAGLLSVGAAWEGCLPSTDHRIHRCLQRSGLSRHARAARKRDPHSIAQRAARERER